MNIDKLSHPYVGIGIWVAVVLIGAVLFLQASVTSIGFVYGNV